MRRLSGIVLAGALLLLAPVTGGGDAFAQQNPFASDLVISSFSVPPARTADYEEILSRLSTALQNSDDPADRAVASGWRVFRGTATMPTGDVVYTHIIEPPAGATAETYGILQRLYAAFPEEQQTLYEMWQGIGAQLIGLSPGNLTQDMGR
jgi:hypothetical protein